MFTFSIAIIWFSTIQSSALANVNAQDPKTAVSDFIEKRPTVSEYEAVLKYYQVSLRLI